MSKIYLHYEGERGPDHTFIWRKAGGLPFTGGDLGEALSAFVESYGKKHGREAYDQGKGMDASRLRLVADPSDPLGAAAAAAKAVILDIASNAAVDPAVVHTGCDIRVEEGAPADEDSKVEEKKLAGGGAASVGGGAAAAAAAPVAEGVAAAKAAAAPVAKGVAAAKAGPNMAAKAKKLALKAERMMARKNLRGARDAAKEALEADPRNARALRCLADTYYKAGLIDEAFAATKECCSKASDGGSPADFLLAGKCLTQLGRYQEAATALGRARTAGTGGLVDDADAGLAFCRFKMGDAPGAGNMYMEVLQRTGEKHIESLVGYGRLALMFNQADKGVPSLLRAIMSDQDNKETRKVLAGSLGIPEGMQALKAQVVPSKESSSVFSFLGTITKDHGQIDTSVQLLEVAASVDPTNASCALGLVHGHEIRGDYAKALASAKAFLERNPDLGVGARGVKNSTVLKVLEGVSACSSSSPSSPPPVFEDLGKTVHWTTLPNGGLASHGPASEAGSADDDISFAWCDDDDATAPAQATVTAMEDDGVEVEAEREGGGGRSERQVYQGLLQAGGGGKEMYAPEHLDVLALYFAVVKILYLEGKWSCLPQLLGLVEPARLRSLMPLHKTAIRNEQAYYCCITQLLASWTRRGCATTGVIGTTGVEEEKEKESVEGGGNDGDGDGKEEAVYVCGDSHTLTPAWHQVTVGGKRRVLRPALVTGLKHWHLRPESDFYPKKNFESVMAKVPNGSAVVFVLGEIDCREGILVAVEKLRYKTAAKGMEHTVGIFIKVAEALSRERGLRIFVHPVIPVLDETRGMVKIYNRVFRRMVDKSKHLHWLDFFDQLLDDKGTSLRPEFGLDGTHLAAGYVGLLEKALADVWVERRAAAQGGRAGKKK